MSVGDTQITVVGNLTADPDLRYTKTGDPVAAFTVAASRRVYDQTTGQWRDADTLFLRCSAWRQLAEHICDSLAKGTRMLVIGRLKQRQYETPEGEKRTVYEVDVDEVGPSLRYATAKITKISRSAVPHPVATGGGSSTDQWSSSPPPAGNTANGAQDDGDRPPY